MKKKKTDKKQLTKQSGLAKGKTFIRFDSIVKTKLVITSM